MSSAENFINKIKKKLSSNNLEEHKILKYFGHLQAVEVDVDILKNTGIGKVVNGFKKHDGIIGEAASELVLKWKAKLTKQQDGNQAQEQRPSLLNSSTTKQLEVKTKEKDDKQHSSSKKDTKKTKTKGPGMQLCDISFGCETAAVSKESRPKKKQKHSSSTRTREIEDWEYNSVGSLPPLPTIASVNEALLPDIQPTYRPNRLPVFDDSPSRKKRGADIDGTYVGEIKSKKSKTQVFSGKRNLNSSGVVPSLFESCIKVLVENIEALHETGGVPYYILHPVLSKCTPQQLLHLEECNPEIIEESDELWMTHYRREFKSEYKLKGRTWRESYLEKCEEREEKLKKINAKISASQAAKKPERQVILAYAESLAKPPPQIRRKQAKFGTAHGTPGNEVPSNTISPIKPKNNHKIRHTSNYSSHTTLSHEPSISTRISHVPSLVSQPQPIVAPPRRPPSAPLLKKTMKMFKNQRTINGSQIRRR